MIEGRLSQVAQHIQGLQQSIQEHQTVINQQQPEQSVGNYIKLQQHKQEALGSITEEEIHSQELVLVVKDDIVREVDELVRGVRWEKQ